MRKELPIMIFTALELAACQQGRLVTIPASPTVPRPQQTRPEVPPATPTTPATKEEKNKQLATPVSPATPFFFVPEIPRERENEWYMLGEIDLRKSQPATLTLRYEVGGRSGVLSSKAKIFLVQGGATPKGGEMDRLSFSRKGPRSPLFFNGHSGRTPAGWNALEILRLFFQGSTYQPRPLSETLAAIKDVGKGLNFYLDLKVGEITVTLKATAAVYIPPEQYKDIHPTDVDAFFPKDQSNEGPDTVYALTSLSLAKGQDGYQDPLEPIMEAIRQQGVPEDEIKEKLWELIKQPSFWTEPDEPYRAAVEETKRRLAQNIENYAGGGLAVRFKIEEIPPDLNTPFYWRIRKEQGN